MYQGLKEAKISPIPSLSKSGVKALTQKFKNSSEYWSVGVAEYWNLTQYSTPFLLFQTTRIKGGFTSATSYKEWTLIFLELRRATRFFSKMIIPQRLAPKKLFP